MSLRVRLSPHSPAIPNYRVLIYQDKSRWIAMTLEKWVVATGRNRQEALMELRRCVILCHANGWIKDYERAPQFCYGRQGYRRLWTGANRLPRDPLPRLIRRGSRHPKAKVSGFSPARTSVV